MATPTSPAARSINISSSTLAFPPFSETVNPMKKYHFMWLAASIGVSLPFIIPGCAGTLTAEEIAALQGGGSTGTAGMQDCAITAFNKSCTTDGTCHSGGAHGVIWPGRYP